LRLPLTDLPPEVDPFGENGELHTFVNAGPLFSAPIGCRRGEDVERDGFVFCDLVAQWSPLSPWTIGNGRERGWLGRIQPRDWMTGAGRLGEDPAVFG
jgi:hypothetical protein